MARRSVIVALALLIAGCGEKQFGFAVAITLHAADSASSALLGQVAHLVFTAGGDETGSFQLDVTGIRRQERVLYRPNLASRNVSIRIDALDTSNQMLLSGATGPIALSPGKTRYLTVELDPISTNPNDMAVADEGGGNQDFGPVSDLAAVLDLHSTDDAAVASDMASSFDAADAAGPSVWRKSITIDNTKVGGSQSDFPVWIDLTDADLAAHARADGQGIQFIAADGVTALDYQLQLWDAASHRLNAWVRLPSLSSAAPTTLYVQYGDAAGSVAPNPAGVFRSSFAAVWHLDDASPTTAIADATGIHPGTPTLGGTSQLSAQLGKGLSFSGNTDNIAFTNPLSGSQAHTISMWVNQPTVTHASTYLVVGSSMSGQSRWLVSHISSAILTASYFSDDWNTGHNLEGAGWTLVHWVAEGANNKNHLYLNGVEIAGSPSSVTSFNTQGTAGFIGYAPQPAYGSATGLTGIIDEVRISTIARSAAWIATEYANQSSPGTFYSVGAEEVVR